MRLPTFPSLALAASLAIASCAPALADDKPAAPPAAPAAPAPDAKPADAPAAKPAPTPIDPKNAAEPGKAASARQCVESILVFAEKDDLEKSFSFMAEPYRTSMPKIIGASRTAKAADETLQAAMDAKWGPGASASVPMRPKTTKFVEGSYGIVDVKEDGDKATVVTREITPKDPKKGPREESFECEKREGFWFASPPRKQGQGRPPVSPEQEAKMADAMSAAIAASATQVTALADDVTAGKLAAKEEVKPKYQAIQMGIMQALMKEGMGAMPKAQPKPPAPAPEGDKAPPK